MSGCRTPANDHIMGQFTAGAPVYTGKLNCECLLWPDCPMFKRPLQDEHYVFAPETIEKGPADIREKIASIRGVDGIFLAPTYTYRHNFLAMKAGQDPNTLKYNYKFISGIDESLVNAFLKKDASGNVVHPVSLQGGEPGHHTWIDDGSLYVTEIFPDELDNLPPSPVDDFKMKFYPQWEYYLHNAPPESTVSGGQSQTKQQDNYKHMPYQSKASPGDPIFFLNNLAADQQQEFRITLPNGPSLVDTYQNINPGIHWRVVKRTPMFQGEDFWVEFHRKSSESDISITKGSKFRTRVGYEFLDPYAAIEPGAADEVSNVGIVEVGKNQEKIEESLKVFDLSDQAYYIIEIGYQDAIHNYFLIIAERDNPILCHAGKVYIRKTNPDASSQTGSGGSTASSGNQDCVGESPSGTASQDPTGGSPTQVVLSKSKILRRLSRYKYATSRKLMEQERLKVMIRQHFGKLIITFSNFENQPWVISRSDLTPAPSSQDAPDSAEDFQVQSIPIIIPNQPIALMGGNAKVAFTFSPLGYKRVDSAPLTQRLSAKGPVDMDDIQLLLRDKGLSKDPNVSTRARTYEFSQESEEYREFINGRIRTTKAMRVQDKWVEKYGKAPDAQRSSDRRRKPFVLQLAAKDCTKRIGSTAPNVKVVEVDLSILPGDYIFPAPDDDGGPDWIAQSIITPIFTGFRLYVPPDGEAFDSPNIDVGHHVMKITDSWQETDMLRIQHSGRIQFLINYGMDNRFADGRPNYANYIRSLNNKNFYIRLSLWWDVQGGMPTPPLDRDKVIFTGICTNASITEENGKHVMTCDMHDYSKVLQEQPFMNSPFFDKMRDFNAVYEIIKMSGLRDDDNLQPGALIRRLAESDKSGWFQLPHNGETIYNQEYSLPGSYNILQEPFFKFKEGTTYADAINKIGQISGKVIYFDRLGVFHYEKLPYDQELFSGQQGAGDAPIFDWSRLSRIDFFASPKDVPAGEGTELHRLVYDSYTVSRDMDSVINQIRVISNTPDGELLLAGHTNFDSLFDIEKPGFVGYPKTLLQMDGIFGDEQNVKWIVKNYTKLFLPPIKIRFRAIGHNLIKALDIVTFRGLGWRDKQVLIVGSVNSEIDPESQTWWQDFECYWIYPSQNIEWGNTNDVSIGVDTAINP